MNHVVVGGGPVGRATVRVLLEAGEQVRLVSRSRRMEPIAGRLEVVQADATDPAQLQEVFADAHVVYNCANAPYHRWPELLPPLWNGILRAVVDRAAAAHDVPLRYVIASNLYALGAPGPRSNPGAEPLTADASFAPCTRKGRVRAELEQRALATGEEVEGLRVGIVRASDFYGPEVLDSVLGERFFAPLIEGKPATLYGRDVPHSYAYLPDFARALADLGRAPADADVWGRSWIAPHAPATPASELQAILNELTTDEARVRIMGGVMLRLGALFVPAAREMVEMLYEFDRPFAVGAGETTRVLGTQHTGLAEGFAETLEWYRATASERADGVMDEQTAAT